MNEMTNSHILYNRFDYFEPVSLREAIALLSHYGERAQVLAGGTDLLVHMKMERVAPEAVVSIKCIPGLDRIAVEDGHLRIGARTTIAAMGGDRHVQAHYAALGEACSSFSTTQVATMGTVGGNLANGSPASDSAPALVALGAEVEIAGPGGLLRLPVEAFFLGPGKTALQKGELLTGIILPRPAAGTGSAFFKIGRVAADIAKASCAAVVVREGNAVKECRLAFGSVAPTPVHTRKAEQMLAGQTYSKVLVEQAAQAAAEEVAPIDDVRSTASYRREVVRALACDALQRAWHRAGQGSAVEWDGAGTREEGTREQGRMDAAEGAANSPIKAEEKRLIELSVNGRKHTAWVSPNHLLLNVLRDQLQLMGTKYGCGIGECSACTVLMDGRPVLACLVLAVSTPGHNIVTVEGLQKPGGELDPLQEAFLDYAAYQCGYCTPGMLMTAKSLLTEMPRPTEDDVRHYLRGNLCRCTGYASIVRAVLSCVQDEPA